MTNSADERKKRAGSRVILGMIIGLGAGTALGVATDAVGTWLPIGVAAGFALGLAMSGGKNGARKP